VISDDELLEKLRELPPEGREPDWHEFGRDLREAIDRDQRGVWGWLRRWWKPAFGLSLACAAAAIVLVVHHGEDVPVATATIAHYSPPVPVPVPVPAAHPEAPLALGSAGTIPADDLDDDAVDNVHAALGADADGLDDDDDLADEDGLVPDLSLDWVDDLDDAQMDRVEKTLAQADHHHAG